MNKKIAITCLSILLAASCWSDEIEEFLALDETIITPERLDQEALNKGNRPKIESFLVPTEAINQLPKLKPYLQDDPDYNKIIFRIKNFPPNNEIILETKRLATLTPSAFERKMSFFIQSDGTLTGLNGNKIPGQIIVTSAKGYLPGERVTYRFRTADGTVSDQVALYPQPIIARDKSGNVVLRAEITKIIPTVYTLEFPTMKEGEEYELKSTSLGEIVKSKAKYKKGTPIHYSPEAEGFAKGGSARLEVKRKSEDAYIVTLPWGTLLKSYISGDLKYP